MKKILIALFALLVVSCSKENEQEFQDFSVNVYYTYSEHENYGEKIAEPSTVILFKDNGNEIDITKTNTFDPILFDANGNKLEIIRTSPTTAGINTFENIENGNYVILVLYAPYTYVRYYSYKRINVNYDYRAKTEKIVFDCSKNSGYQMWKQ